VAPIVADAASRGGRVCADPANFIDSPKPISTMWRYHQSEFEMALATPRMAAGFMDASSGTAAEKSHRWFDPHSS
jgi:hypothetical protein